MQFYLHPVKFYSACIWPG